MAKNKTKGCGVQFHRQVPLLEYIVDFYCHELLLLIEVDGDSHDFKDECDVKRQIQLEKYGIIFLRFSDLEVKNNLFNVLHTIENKVVELQKLSP